MHIYTYETDLKPEEVFLLVLLLSKVQTIKSPIFFFFSFFVLFWGEGWMLREPQENIEVVFLLVSTVNQDEICSF